MLLLATLPQQGLLHVPALRRAARAEACSLGPVELRLVVHFGRSLGLLAGPRGRRLGGRDHQLVLHAGQVDVLRLVREHRQAREKQVEGARVHGGAAQQLAVICMQRRAVQQLAEDVKGQCGQRRGEWEAQDVGALAVVAHAERQAQQALGLLGVAQEDLGVARQAQEQSEGREGVGRHRGGNEVAARSPLPGPRSRRGRAHQQ